MPSTDGAGVGASSQDSKRQRRAKPPALELGAGVFGGFDGTPESDPEVGAPTPRARGRASALPTTGRAPTKKKRKTRRRSIIDWALRRHSVPEPSLKRSQSRVSRITLAETQKVGGHGPALENPGTHAHARPRSLAQIMAEVNNLPLNTLIKHYRTKRLNVKRANYLLKMEKRNRQALHKQLRGQCVTSHVGAPPCL